MSLGIWHLYFFFRTCNIIRRNMPWDETRTWGRSMSFCDIQLSLVSLKPWFKTTLPMVKCITLVTKLYLVTIATVRKSIYNLNSTYPVIRCNIQELDSWPLLQPAHVLIDTYDAGTSIPYVTDIIHLIRA